MIRSAVRGACVVGALGLIAFGVTVVSLGVALAQLADEVGRPRR